MKVIKYEMITYTPNGRMFKKGVYKTRRSMNRAKERYNLLYGAHLKATVVEYLEDGSMRNGLCFA